MIHSYGRTIDSLRQRLSHEDYIVATKIFAWVSFAERPLKEQEILTGLVLAGEHGVVNNDTRLARRILDAAKPLVEVMNNSVTFVHFTVKK